MNQEYADIVIDGSCSYYVQFVTRNIDLFLPIFPHIETLRLIAQGKITDGDEGYNEAVEECFKLIEHTQGEGYIINNVFIETVKDNGKRVFGRVEDLKEGTTLLLKKFYTVITVNVGVK